MEENTNSVVKSRNRVIDLTVRWGEAPIAPRSASRIIGPVLYACRLPSGLIKIGFTVDVQRRRLELESRNGHPVTLLAIKPADPSDESAVHQSLSSHCARGREYYHPTPDVLAVVNRWRVDLGLPPEPA